MIRCARLPIVISLTAATLASERSFAQQSAQFLDAPVLAVPSYQERMNALCDIDGDGWIDAVGAFVPTNDTARFSAFRNDATGRLAPLWHVDFLQYAEPTMPFPVAAGDFDGDGKPDFAVALRDELRIYKGNGASAPTQKNYFVLGSGMEAADLQIGDYDGDGRLDVAVRLYGLFGADPGLTIFNKLSTATPGSSVHTALPTGTGRELRNIDIDANGVMDLMCVGDTRVDFVKLNGSQIQVAGSYAHGLTNQPMGAAGDVDGDGDVDVAVWGMSGNYRVLRRTGSATFAFGPIGTGGPATDLADVDNDGDLDGVCCGGGGGPTTFTNSAPSWFEIAKNDGTGSFAPSFKLPSMGANHIAGVADVDHDGDPDLVAGRIVYYNVHGIEPAKWSTTTAFPTYDNVVDVDGDGDFDVAPSLLGFERNDGAGAFTAVSRMVPLPPAGSTFGTPVFAGDYDGDGDSDLIVTESVNGVATNQRLLIGNGGGGLNDAGPVTAPGVLFASGPNTFAKAFPCDVDGDGQIDVVVSSMKTSGFATLETRVFQRDSSGQLALQSTIPGEFVQSVWDIDGDGRGDLVVVKDTDVGIRFGDANTPFATFTGLATGSISNLYPPGEVPCVADLDGDGDLDLVFAIAAPAPDQNLTMPRLCENVGGRQFVAHDDLDPTYRGALSPALAGDINGDGAIDLLLGQREIPGLVAAMQSSSVFLGSNAPGLDFTYQGEQWPIVYSLTDLDGDGDLDALGGYLTHFFNHQILQPAGGIRRQYGEATAGAFGQKPTMGASGSFHGGMSAELRMTGAAANNGGLLLVGIDDQAAKLAATGGFVVTLPIVVTVSLVLPGKPGEIGSGALTIPYTVPLAAVGASWFHQFLVLDAGAKGGAALSNGLEIFYAP